ncbi:MAG TPA: hypothetical protein VF272_04535 [Candidatus Saccharimonadia bacterium]
MRRAVAFILLLASLIGLSGWSHTSFTASSESDVGAELPVQTGGIRFVGEASPSALVTFQRNGSVIGTQVAGSDSSFDMTFTTQPLGSATYSIYATDLSSRTTAEITTIATILPAFTTTLSGYLLPTTFSLALNPIKRPQTQVASGTARHNSTVTTLWSGTKYSDSFTTQDATSASGNWNGSPSQTLHLGTYTTSAVVQAPGGALSPQSPDTSFQVVLSADLNNDTKINLTDFSILMFFYLQININKPADINDDTKTNLTDFSIMLFFWTG